MTALHPESLLRVPLVRLALEHAQLRPLRRPVDAAWHYHGLIPSSVVGFNPFGDRFFVAGRSQFESWREAMHGSARDFNARDRLVREVLISVHDFLHAWAYALVRALRPEFELGTTALDESALDDVAFIHLLSEAVATVGLDYWYLSTLDLNDVCDLGTSAFPLSTSFHHRDLAEFTRWSPTFDAQRPQFLGEMLGLYCSGVFQGFSLSDVQRSPKLERWMSHEVLYARTQRAQIRAWLSFLVGRTPTFDSSPLVVDGYADLVGEVAERLWSLVKHGQTSPLDPAPLASTWRPTRFDDFRFVNLAALPPTFIENVDPQALSPASLTALMHQFVALHVREGVAPHEVPIVEAALSARSLPALIAFFSGRPRVPVVDEQPASLLCLS